MWSVPSAANQEQGGADGGNTPLSIGLDKVNFCWHTPLLAPLLDVGADRALDAFVGFVGLQDAVGLSCDPTICSLPTHSQGKTQNSTACGCGQDQSAVEVGYISEVQVLFTMFICSVVRYNVRCTVLP